MHEDFIYLTPPGLHVEHVGREMLQGDELSEVHVLVEELRSESEQRFQRNCRFETHPNCLTFISNRGHGLSHKGKRAGNMLGEI